MAVQLNNNGRKKKNSNLDKLLDTSTSLELEKLGVSIERLFMEMILENNTHPFQSTSLNRWGV